MTEKVIPELKNEITPKIKAELDGVDFVSFTTNTWNTDVSHDSLLSLTAHWITSCFVKKSAVLHARSLPGSHTGENIAAVYAEMFKKWSIEKQQIHVIV